MQMQDMAQYMRMFAALVVAFILAWTLARKRQFSFRRFQALARWSVGITIASVMISDIVASGPYLWSPHFAFHCLVAVAATIVMTKGYLKQRRASKEDAHLPPPRASRDRTIFAAVAICLSLIWLGYVHLRPSLSDGLAEAVRDYGWALMGAVWGVVINTRFASKGVRRPRVLAFVYGVAVFAACGLLGSSGDLGRMVAPGIFLIMQIPILRMQTKQEAVA